MPTAQAPSPVTAQPRAPVRVTSLSVGSLLLSGSVIALTLVLSDPQRVVQQLTAVDVRWVCLVLLLSVVQLALLGLRWQWVGRALDLRFSFRQASAECALSTCINQLVPGGYWGDGLRALRLARHPGAELRLGRAFEAVALDRLSGQTGLWLVVLLGLPWTASLGIFRWRLAGEQLAATVLLGAALALTLLLLLASALWLLRPAWARRAQLGVSRFARRAGAVLLSPRKAWGHLLLSLLLVLGLLGQFYASARAIGVELPWVWLLGLGPLIFVAASLPSFFGGWGVREAASGLLFAQAGAQASTGVAVCLAFGAFSLWAALPGLLVLVLGAPGMAQFGAQRWRKDTWGSAHALSLLLTSVLALWWQSFLPLAAVAGLSMLVLLVSERSRWTPQGTFGGANVITSVRLLGTLGLLVWQWSPLWIACAALGVVLLDVADGYLARRCNWSSEFGSRFDVESDALLVLSLSLLLYTQGLAGAWVLLAGCWRYVFVLAPLLVVPRGNAAQRSRLGRAAYVVMILCFVAAFALPQPWAAGVAAWGTLTVSASFLLSFWQQYVPAAVTDHA